MLLPVNSFRVQGKGNGRVMLGMCQQETLYDTSLTSLNRDAVDKNAHCFTSCC